jgi:hypothetical protein
MGLIITESEKNEILGMYNISNNNPLILERKGIIRKAKKLADLFLNNRGFEGMSFNNGSLSRIFGTHGVYNKVEGDRIVQTDDIDEFYDYTKNFLSSASDKEIFQFLIINDPQFFMKFIYEFIEKNKNNPTDETIDIIVDYLIGLQDNAPFELGKYSNLKKDYERMLNYVNSEQFANARSAKARMEKLIQFVPLKTGGQLKGITKYFSGRQIRRIIKILSSFNKDLVDLNEELSRVVNNPSGAKDDWAKNILDLLDSIETSFNAEAKSLYEQILKNDKVPQGYKDVLERMTEDERKIELWDEISSSTVIGDVGKSFKKELGNFGKVVSFGKIFTRKPSGKIGLDTNFLKQYMANFLRIAINGHGVSLKDWADKMVSTSSRGKASLMTYLTTILTVFLPPALISLFLGLGEIIKYINNNISFFGNLFGDDWYSEYEPEGRGSLVAFLLGEIMESWSDKFGKDNHAFGYLQPVFRGPLSGLIGAVDSGNLEQYNPEDHVPTDPGEFTPPAEVVAYNNDTGGFKQFLFDNGVDEDNIKKLSQEGEYWTYQGKEDNVKMWYKHQDNTFVRH